MKKKILIIEDSRADAAMEQAILEQSGFDAQIAHNGNDGIKKAIEMMPDLIVLDLMLPDISGFDVCAKIRKENFLKDAIIVIVSIRDNVEDIKKAFRVGADDYVVKPPDPEFLLRKVKLYLGVR